jgi:hypothetical protein
MKKTFVRFYYPGSFFSESSDLEVEDRDISKLNIPKNCFCLKFFDIVYGEIDEVETKSGELNYSKNYFIGGKLYTLDEIRKEFPYEDILISNMKLNNWGRLIRCRTKNRQPFDEENDVILEDK